MSSKEIAIDGATLKHGAGSGASGGSFTITSVPSISSKVKGKGIYKNPISYTFVGGNGGGCVAGTVSGSGTIAATTIVNKVDGILMMRKGDSGIGAFSGTNPAAPPPTLPVVAIVEIDASGQVPALVTGE